MQKQHKAETAEQEGSNKKSQKKNSTTNIIGNVKHIEPFQNVILQNSFYTIISIDIK